MNLMMVINWWFATVERGPPRDGIGSSAPPAADRSGGSGSSFPRQYPRRQGDLPGPKDHCQPGELLGVRSSLPAQRDWSTSQFTSRCWVVRSNVEPTRNGKKPSLVSAIPSLMMCALLDGRTRFCLVAFKILKLYKIFYHIKYFNACMKY